jgi:5-amino-6-(5-phospho-D-ribitylamino)uracil phosphatase
VKPTTPYRLLALDMDGTLLNEESQISEMNRRWIAEAGKAGVTVLFSTGRGRQSALPFAEQLSLDSPMVLVNGSEVWRSPSELHKRVLMPVEQIRELRRLALEYDVWYWSYAVEGIFNRENWPEEEAAVDGMGWLKFGYYSENPDKLPAIRQLVESQGLYAVTNSHPCNLELNPAGISKASGLREVCALMGLEMSQVIAVGDSVNDLTMIREAGLGVAMGNAQDQVKAEADAVTAANTEDGVACVIRKYIFGLE